MESEKSHIDSRAQARSRLCEATIAEYAEGYQNGAASPPITLHFDGQSYWLADGFHRYFGAQPAGKKQILKKSRLARFVTPFCTRLELTRSTDFREATQTSEKRFGRCLTIQNGPR